jgi:hypothetical protein
MNPHKLTLNLFLFLCLALTSPQIATAQQRKPPVGGRLAIVVDERLAALRSTPELTGRLVRRLSRGRLVAVRSARTSRDGIVFYSVNVSTRTQGWIQREAVVLPSRPGDDQRLLRLITAADGFDRIARARIFLDYFPRSPLRAEVLLMLGTAAEAAAEKLSRDAVNRINPVTAGAPEFSYFLNYTGLDRYNRLRVGFVFDQANKRFHYDGAALRELVRRYPHTPQAAEARKQLDALFSQLRTW